MISSHKRLLCLASLTAALFATGCSDQADLTAAGGDSISGENALQEIDLDLAYGGLAFSDEEPAFGDQMLKAEAEREELRASEEDEGESLVLQDPELRDADAVRIFVRVLWGNLDGRPEDSAGDAVDYARVDWSGGMSVDNGVILLKKTILFEPFTDHLLPRDDRQSLGWASMTGPHKDGVLVCVVARPNEDGLLEGQLSFETGPLSLRLALSDLDELDEVYGTEIDGVSVSFVALSERPEDCPRGFLGGYWQTNAEDEHDGGWFRGRVTNASGRLRGYMAGRFGLNGAGERVFRGKFIDREGQILGLLGGRYQPAADGSGMGEFRGRWVNRNGDVMGVLGGRYESLPGGGAGFFHGRWMRHCLASGGAEG